MATGTVAVTGSGGYDIEQHVRDALGLAASDEVIRCLLAGEQPSLRKVQAGDVQAKGVQNLTEQAARLRTQCEMYANQVRAEGADLVSAAKRAAAKGGAAIAKEYGQ